MSVLKRLMGIAVLVNIGRPEQTLPEPQLPLGETDLEAADLVHTLLTDASAVTGEGVVEGGSVSKPE